jgi:hypothetical protein
VTVQLPKVLRTRAFTVAEAREHGLSHKVLQGSRFRRLFHGVYVAADVEDSVGLWADAATLLLPDGFFFSHVTAASLYRLPLPVALSAGAGLAGVDVRGRPGIAAPRVAGIHVHRPPLAALADMSLFENRRLTAPAATWMDLAATLPFDDLVALGDGVLHRAHAGPELFDDVLLRSANRPGVQRARLAQPLLEPRTDSPGETWVRLTLLRAGLPRPLANHDLLDEHRQWVARPDFLYVDPPVIIQYDGGEHFRGLQRRRHDAARDELSRDLGFEVVVATALDRGQPGRFVDRVVSARARATGRHHRGLVVDRWAEESHEWAAGGWAR